MDKNEELADLATRAANTLYSLGTGLVLDDEVKAQLVDISRNLGKMARSVKALPVQRHKIGDAQTFPGREPKPVVVVELDESTLREGAPRGKSFDWRNHQISQEQFEAAHIVTISIGGLSMLAKHRNGMPSGVAIKANGALAPVQSAPIPSGADTF